MGSDLHMSPPAPPVYRLVSGKEYVALYSRATDSIVGKEAVENWTLQFSTDDPDENVVSGMHAVLSRTAHGRFLQLNRDDLVTPTADSPFPESLPREELEKEHTQLEKRAMVLRKELAEVEKQISDGKTEE